MILTGRQRDLKNSFGFNLTKESSKYFLDKTTDKRQANTTKGSLKRFKLELSKKIKTTNEKANVNADTIRDEPLRSG